MIEQDKARHQSAGPGERILLPLSAQQARWWYLDEIYGTARCQTSVLLELRGRLDQQTLRAAFERLVCRHAILRARVQADDSGVRQYVASGAEALSLRDHSVDGRWSAEQLCQLDAEERLSLEAGSLIRGRLIRLPDHAYLLLLTLHPIICDGASLDPLIRELLILYRAGVTGAEDRLPLIATTNDNFSIADSWQQGDGVLPQKFGRWRAIMGGSSDPWLAPRVGPPSVPGVLQKEHVSVPVSRVLTTKLRELAHKQGLEPRTVLLGAWAALLARWFKQPDALLGVELKNAARSKESPPQVGQFSDLALIEIGVGAGTTVLALLREIDRAVKQCSPVEQGSWERACAMPPHRDQPQPVIPVAIGVDAQLCLDELTLVDIPGITVGRVSTERCWPCAAISVLLEDSGTELTATLQYFPDLVAREIVQRVGEQWISLLESMPSSCDGLVGDMSLPAALERERTKSGVNDGLTKLSINRTVVDLFESQVRRSPDSIAVEHEKRALTYSQLNSRANQLARFLVNQGVRPDVVVGICLERSLEMVITVLAILKAGAAYLPLDSNYPRARLEQMLDDARPEVLITETELVGVLPSSRSKLIELDKTLGNLAGCVDDNLDSAELGLNCDGLAYVIYTSGSTGKPKGIAMPHRAMVNLLEWQRETFGNSGGQRVLQFAALSFDVAFQETFSTLCTGGTLVLLDEWIRRDAKALAEFLVDHCINRLFVPPVMLHSVIDHCEITGIVPTSLCDVITAGEQLRIDAVTRAFFSRLGKCRLHNHYGPTESHVVTAFTLMGDPTEWPTLPPIGRPISNTQIYLLGEDGMPVICGTMGEIYIGGANLARGYLNQPQLTDERFVSNPYSADPAGRLYKTGDLARWSTDGNLEYLGRNDDQVKVRGFRIEVSEIEAQLARCEQVREVAVVAREDSPGEKRLVAYVVLRGEDDAVEQLRENLKEVLPEYMVPSAIVVIERLPQTPSGKIDRRALPAPDPKAFSTATYQSPRGQKEIRVAGIWQELLHVERIGRGDDFFKLGGNSLLVMQMMGRLRRMDLSCEATSVYLHPTLADFAQTISEEYKDAMVVPPNGIPPDCEWITPQMLPLVDLEPEHIRHIARAVPGGARNIQDIYPLAPLQEGLLFHHEYDKHRGDTYVLQTLLSVCSREKLSELILGLRYLIQRHDILRTAVLWEQLPSAVQVVYREATLPIDEVSLDTRRDSRDQLRELMAPERQAMDMRKAPLVHLTVITAPADQCYYALLKLHHFAGDQESVETMFGELIAHIEGRAQALPCPVPFRAHVAFARSLAVSTQAEVEEFFRRKLADVDEPTVPFGLKNVHVDPGRIVQQSGAVEPQLAGRIRNVSRRLGVSPATLFHAAWAAVISRASGKEDVVFGTVLLGRIHGAEASERSLGMFINTLPLRVKLSGVSAEELVKRTHQELTGLLTYEQSSLAVAQRCAGLAGSAPLFGALINYRHVRLRIESGQRELTHGVKVIASLQRTNYPVVLSIDDLGEEFFLTAQTDTAVEPQRLIGYVLTALDALATTLEHAPRTPALALPVVPESELRQILYSFNAGREASSSKKLIHELFEAQARLRPDSIAVSFVDQSLTYDKLNTRANQLAWCLRQSGVKPDEIVGIYMERSLDMIVGLLAILKSGGGYLPLDPAYPSERIAFLLNDASPSVVITQDSLKAKLPTTNATVIAIDRDWSCIAQSPPCNPSLRPTGLNSRSIAYVIYTSGSTGTPKGVMVEHRNVTRLFSATDSWFGFTPQDIWTVFHSFAFDFSVWELWGALINGGRAVIVPYDVARSPQEFYRLVCQEGVTVLNQTPSAFMQFMDAQGRCSGLRHSLRLVVFGGEALELRKLAPWVLRNGAECPRLVNMYGITETTVHVTYQPISKQDIDLEPACVIGKPIPDLRIYILDRRQQPTPIGAAGEMYVAGAGVARGYLNRQELTAERFVPDPFNRDKEARMYRTGDIGCWRSDGSIHYLGRNDDQVKIRGFRIELSEIEAQLVRHAAVKEAVVLAREDVPGEKRLVAYVVGDRQRLRDADSPASSAKLRDATVTEWRALYEDTYRKGDVKSRPSFVGWNSSYTGQPIPEPEMQEWLACTIERISSRVPRSVLEIGCGVGLVLERLAPQCDKYVATDFSDAALSQLHAWIDGDAKYQHVTLLQRSALELQEFPSGSFDTVVLNSVIQYFPDLDYLLTVLREAVRLLRLPGRIFVGDVRHFGLLSTFHSAVQLSKAPATLCAGPLRSRIAMAIAQEKELVIDPAFFESLPDQFPAICAADVQLKSSRADNELTNYRYDVFLEVGEETCNRPALSRLEWRSGVNSLSSLSEALEQRAWPTARICGIPNSRLGKDAIARRLIQASDAKISAGALRKQVRDGMSGGIDPAEVCGLAESHGYAASLHWGESADAEEFDVTLIDRAREHLVPRAVRKAQRRRNSQQTLSNDPLDSAFRQELVPKLRELARESLPDYMVPSAYVVLKELPITVNGKLDRRMLPAPQGRPEEIGEYVAPRSELERLVANTWAQVLRVDQVGVYDNFLELGGHSLLATRITNQVSQALELDLSVRAIFDNPTVDSLARSILKGIANDLLAEAS